MECRGVRPSRVRGTMKAAGARGSPLLSPLSRKGGLVQGFLVSSSERTSRWCRRASRPPAGARGVLASPSYPPPPQAAKRAIRENQKALWVGSALVVFGNRNEYDRGVYYS